MLNEILAQALADLTKTISDLINEVNERKTKGKYLEYQMEMKHHSKEVTEPESTRESAHKLCTSLISVITSVKSK